MQRLYTFVLILLLSACNQTNEPASELTVGQVMDDVITRLYEKVPSSKYDSIDDSFMLAFLNDEEKKILATRYMYFEVDVPVVVSLMRDRGQPIIPFWIAEAGFVKTDQVVKNAEGYVYDVWEKRYDAGKIELGINGFDKHRPVYFITVGPQDVTDKVNITNVYP